MCEILLTVKEVAQILKVDCRTVFRLFQAKIPLPSVKLGGSRRVLQSDLMEFIKRRKTGGLTA